MLRWGILLWYATFSAIIGIVIGYFATRYGGEGKATAGR
jgi:ABC-type microcin C transport system permease subunit YejE